MKGFPKHINTKKDVYKLMDLYPERMKKILQNGIDGYKNWVTTGYYDTESECKEDDTHTYSVEETEEGGTVYIQKEWKVVPKNFLDRIGLSVEEAEKLLI